MLCDFKNCPNKRLSGSKYCNSHKDTTLDVSIKQDINYRLHTSGTLLGKEPERKPSKQLLKKRCQFPNCLFKAKRNTGWCLQHHPDPPKKKIKKNKRVSLYRNKLNNFAKSLQNKEIKSEVWFMQYYKFFEDKNDLFNVPLGGYIPDIHNKKYRYVIEIDGTIHNTEKQKEKDLKKDKVYKALRYKIIRITYDKDKPQESMESLRIGLLTLCKIKHVPKFTMSVKDIITGLEFNFSYDPINN